MHASASNFSGENRTSETTDRSPELSTWAEVTPSNAGASHKICGLEKSANADCKEKHRKYLASAKRTTLIAVAVTSGVGL